MKTEKNILVAFILNFAFSVFEFIGGTWTGSVAILSDSIHDLGDSMSIGIAWFLERKSKKQPDDTFTYGYLRYSVIGSVITSVILLLGSAMVIWNAIKRLINPVQINYSGMIVFAVFGVVVNFLAAYFTRSGDSLNQKAVNLHMLEDVLGWVVVLLGAIIMKFTDISVIDPIMSICVALFILVHTVENLKEALDLFLEKKPEGISMEELMNHVRAVDGVIDLHHVHIWSLDGVNNCATMHIVTDCDPKLIKSKVREELSEHGISHVTLELETSLEDCGCEHCVVDVSSVGDSHGHHHHH